MYLHLFQAVFDPYRNVRPDNLSSSHNHRVIEPHGLIDYLRGDIPLDEAMASFAEIPCWIMPAGESEADPTELLKTGHLEHVFSNMRERFD